ncbi:hypothetical protein NLJ89_g6729 [Agrocybe chaxingu]|uniref:Uncharacterized protein n=1 Tax=Agrocybe chaxingu TaxID=84603 RepID=A0A9W8MSE3_9AGAR|nr:hypothetical protein NLJ89_g6729 [Agrocybe chaxingu]
MVSFTRILTIASLAVAAMAAPAPEPEALDAVELVERATCNTAYGGAGTTYTCRKVSWVITSYVCYVGSGPTYCCSGNLVSTSDGPMVGGCF